MSDAETAIKGLVNNLGELCGLCAKPEPLTYKVAFQLGDKWDAQNETWVAVCTGCARQMESAAIQARGR